MNACKKEIISNTSHIAIILPGTTTQMIQKYCRHILIVDTASSSFICSTRRMRSQSPSSSS